MYKNSTQNICRYLITRLCRNKGARFSIFKKKKGSPFFSLAPLKKNGFFFFSLFLPCFEPFFFYWRATCFWCAIFLFEVVFLFSPFSFWRILFFFTPFSCHFFRAAFLRKPDFFRRPSFYVAYCPRLSKSHWSNYFWDFIFKTIYHKTNPVSEKGFINYHQYSSLRY